MARRVEIFNNQWRIHGRGPGGLPSPPPLFLDRTDAQRAEKICGGGETRLIAGRPSPHPLISRSGSDSDNNHTIEDCMRDLLEDALHLAARTLLFAGISQSSLMSFFYSSFRTHSLTPLVRCTVTLLVTSILLAWLVYWVTRE